MRYVEQATPNAMLRRERELRGWSQSYVAELIQAPAPSYISRWERGQTSPSPFYREKLCRIFDKNAEQLGLLSVDEEMEANGLDSLTLLPDADDTLSPTEAQSLEQKPASEDEHSEDGMPHNESFAPSYPRMSASTPLNTALKVQDGMRQKHIWFSRRVRILALLVIASLCALLFLPLLFQAPQPEPPRRWPTIAFDSSTHEENVRTLQFMLVARGYEIGRSGVDGIFGVQTEQAVRTFQKEHALQVTGIVNSLVWESLVVPASKGERGSVVQALQRQLNMFRPQLKLARDGVYGPKVEQAVRAFQQAKGLPTHGRADRDTWCLLMGGTLVH